MTESFHSLRLVELAYLTDKEQEQFLDAMEYTQAMPSLSQAQRIKELSKIGELNFDAMVRILGEVKRGDTNRVMFKNEQMYQYFPRKYTPEMMKKEILEMTCRNWAGKEATCVC